MKRWIKRILFWMAFLAFVGAVVYAFLPKPVPVDLAGVERGTLEVTVDEDGKTRVRDRYVIAAPLAGRLMRQKLRAGDLVPKGEPLAVIEPSEPGLIDARALAQAEARIRVVKSDIQKAGANRDWARYALELAEAEKKRAEGLAERNAASKADLDIKRMQWKTRQEELHSAVFAEEMAKFELSLAEAALTRTRPAIEGDQNARFEIPPPPLVESGRVLHVLRVLQESETVVTPGMSLLEVGDVADLEVEIDVLSSDAVKIPPLARVRLEQWGGEKPLDAHVRHVEKSGFLKISALGVEEQRVNVICDFDDREQIPASLGDGFRVEARIVIWEKADVLQVPTSALFRHGDGWAVFRVDQGHARRTEVTLGRKNGLHAEVLKGLAAGDTVVAHPSDRVVDGVKVVAR